MVVIFASHEFRHCFHLSTVLPNGNHDIPMVNKYKLSMNRRANLLTTLPIEPWPAPIDRRYIISAFLAKFR